MFSVWWFYEQDVWQGLYVRKRSIKGSRTHLRTFRKLVLASWSPPTCKSLFYHTQFFILNTVPDTSRSNREHYSTTCQAVIRSHTSDLPILIRIVLRNCASTSYACPVTVTGSEHPLQRKYHGRTRAGLKTWGRRITRTQWGQLKQVGKAMTAVIKVARWI